MKSTIMKKNIKDFDKLRPELQELIKTGTPRDIAKYILEQNEYIRSWRIDFLPLDRPISVAERMIVERAFSLKEKIEYARWWAIGRTFNDLFDWNASIEFYADSARLQLKRELELWAHYDAEISHLYAIGQMIKGWGNSEAMQAYRTMVNSLPFELMTIEMDEDGDINPAEKSEILSAVKCRLREYNDRMSMAKVYVETVERFVKYNDCADFVPPYAEWTMQRIKTMDEYFPEKNRKVVLKERERKGETITQTERDMAVVPHYEQLSTHEWFRQFAVNKLWEAYDANRKFYGFEN